MLIRVLPLVLSAIWVFLDQLLKAFTVANVGSAFRVVVPNFLSLVQSSNTGAAWSLMQGNSLLLAVLRLGVAVYVLYFLFTNPRLPLVNKIALALIAGGAIGNGIDGISRGFVVDMLYSHWLTAIYKPLFGTIFPIFNLADVGVVCGCILLLVSGFLGQSKSTQTAV